jgi:Fe-S cluster biogenesis protein NfuA
MFIQTVETPNPNTIKFVPGEALTNGDVYDFKTIDETKPSPLAHRLFKLEHIEGVMIGADFISVTKNAEASWDVIKPIVLGALMDHFGSGDYVVDVKSIDVNDGVSDVNAIRYSETDQEIVNQIKDMLDTRIRPAVAVDGGDIIFGRYENGIVYLRLKGACSGCPSSTVTLKNGIENMLRHYIPEVLEVKAEETPDNAT